jgi:hypothetical protein
VTLSNDWGAESLVLNVSIWHFTFHTQNDFKWKTCHIRAGINEYLNTITFGLILLILYSCDNLNWLQSCAIHFMFAPGFMPSGLQMENLFYSSVEYWQYQYDLICLRILNTVLMWNLLTFEELNHSFLMFASANVHSILQIDFNWKNCYIEAGNKYHTNTNSFG